MAQRCHVMDKGAIVDPGMPGRSRRREGDEKISGDLNSRRPPMSNWLNASIMYTKGVAKGKAGATHQLTEAKQGRYHYTMGPYSEPVMQIKPGDRVAVETRDAFEGAIKTEKDLPT